MLIGVPKEIKNHEYRIGCTPTMAMGLVENGHQVLIETKAGARIGFTDEMYRSAGAKIVNTPAEVYGADMIIKVKEPQPSEYELMKEGQILFCYLHLAPDPQQTEALLKQKVVGIAYETVTDDLGRLPLLAPMSEIAGRISVQAGAASLQMANGGRGVLLGGVPGVLPAEVVVIGGGVVGTQAAMMAMGLGADVTILDKNLARLRELDALYNGRLKTLFSSPQIIKKLLSHADLVIGAVLVAGARAPMLVDESTIKSMPSGSVLVDVSIDQGGCFATSKPTTHQDPTYIVHDVVHYCVANMPGACARTATQALTNATYPYVLKIAGEGYEAALRSDAHLMRGLNVYRGLVTNQLVANELGYEYHAPGAVVGTMAPRMA
ncbi:MAG: Alanine dehydrogenase 2 [Chlamydiia bacterium]|nr:Alanine dehydrogenase 2 [Chlamydiia bacterium]